MNSNLLVRDGMARTENLGSSHKTALRFALQIGLATLAPFIGRWIADWQGCAVGFAFGLALAYFTEGEARLMDKRNHAALEHAVAISYMEIREREARLPQPPRPHRPLPPAILSPVPDGEEEQAQDDDEILLADDCRYVFELGKASGTFARAQFIQANRSRLTLPSQVPLTRARYDAIIARLVRDGLLVAALNGSWQISGQAGRQAEPGDSDTPRLAAHETAKGK